MWCPEDVVAAASRALRAEADRLDTEQAVRGIDAWDERDIQPVLAQGLAASGFGVLREQPFPGDASRRPRHSERERCDLVLLERPGLRLRDEIVEVRERDRSAGTLFEAVAARCSKGPTDLVPPSEAMWVEVKVVGQVSYVDGVAVPNRRYGVELVGGPLGDMRKLASDMSIESAASLVVLFTADRETAEHDLAALMHRALDRGLPVRMPVIDGFDLTDRAGNMRCSVALIPVRGRRSERDGPS